MSSGYGIKCEAEALPLLNSAPSSGPTEDLPVNDMDLVGFLDMDDKSLSELTGGMNASEWSSLFNGQLDGLDSLDPMTGIQNSGPMHSEAMANMNPVANNNSGMDVWLLHETQRLERQQKLQQQKLLELQQTLLKTEILKNQLQIATISQGQPSVNSPLHTESGYGFPPSGGPQRPSTVTASRLSVSSSGLSSPATVAVSPASSSLVPPSNPTPPLYDTKPLVVSSLGSPSSPEEPPIFEGDKRKVHNLIEKKYRCSINDRIGILRDKVARNCKDSKRLQKSAVLQKTIDFIEHLEKTITRLEEENRQLKDALSKATNKPRMPSFSSPPATPHTLISPKSHDSEDSGHSSADDYLSDEMMSREPSPNSRGTGGLSMLASHLLQRGAPQYLMVVLLLAVFTLNPASLTMSGPTKAQHGRTLSSLDTNPESDLALSCGLWVLRAALALLAFGWLTVRATPTHASGSDQVVAYWRLRKQAEKDVQNGEFTSAQLCLEKCMEVIGRRLPSTYLGLTLGLLWSLLSHLLFQMMLGQWAVSLARLFLCGTGDRKQGVSALSLSQTYHLLHQINTASTRSGRGQDLYLALNALNFAESAGSPQPEHYLALALHMCSVPLLNRYYFYAFRSLSPGSSPLKWVWSPEGRAYLESGEWRSEVKLGTRLFSGEAALPLYSVSRGFCKTLLCDTFQGLLLREPSHAVLDSASQAFKWTLGVAKELNSHLLSKQEGELTALTQSYDSGFAALQWWSCVGLVACGWLSGGDPQAYYPTVEGGPGDETAVPSTLQLAFKTALTHKRGGSMDVLLQLTSMTSNSLAASVSELLHDNFTSTENQLYRLGLLLATDWLLGVRLLLWETRGSQGVRTGYYQDLETLTKLVGLLPAGLPQLRMYKGCYQLLAGANPVTVQALLGNAGYSQLRRRALAKEPPSSTKVDSIGPSLLAPTSV